MSDHDRPDALATAPVPAVPVLDPMTLPLRGSRLIEASAGTGKTWTIAALYLRLVLGHGTRGDVIGEPDGDGDGDGDGDAGTAFDRPLVPAEILVMTFTRAATRELSDRIRARLVEAARCFRGEIEPRAGDALLPALLADFADPGRRRAAAWRLAMAAEAMDDAAVMTIDAWCQRMLREHAFDSGSAYDETLQPDEAALRAEAVRDYWRHEVYPLAGEALDTVLAQWGSVEALEGDAARLLAHVPPAADDEPLARVVDRVRADQRAAVVALKDGWPARARALRDWVMAQLDSASNPFSGNKLRRDYTSAWLAELVRWADDPADARWSLSESATHRLTPAGMHEALKKGASVVLPPGFDAMAALVPRVQAYVAPVHALRLHAAAQVARRVRDLKARTGTFGFADLLERLHGALGGPNGAALRERIVAQFPAVLIDEFQDTSPLQYRIFDRLYRVEANDPRTALFLIGDPKQSIYAFRGADLRSYLRARRATHGRHAVLGTNHRSTQALVAAVNALFAHAEHRAGRGAFMFRTTGPDPVAVEPQVAAAEPDASDDDVPFVPVAARGRADVLRDAAGPSPALVACVDATRRSGADLLRVFAERCAEDLVARLNDPAAGFERPGAPDGREAFARLRPGDIAVLVRNGTEAAAVRRALRRRGVASVYLSDKDSVFATPEAADLLRWLRAVASPLDGRLARAAWATGTVGLPLDALAALRRDDLAFEARVETLRQLNAVWRRQGVLPMLRQTLHRLALPARWLAAPDGERRLTNVLHLAELLQAAAADLEGEHALIRWLAEQVAGEGAAGDEKLVRLESDADLVQVVTVHKSKGLEYPVVYLPFACTFRGAEKDRSGFVARHDPEAPTGRRLEFGASPKAGDASDQERLQEDLRWLYVALTRPRHLLWLGVAAVGDGRSTQCLVHRSALGYLLNGEAPLEAAALPVAVARAFEGVGGVRIENVTSTDGGDDAGDAGDADDVVGGQGDARGAPCTMLARRDDAPPLVEAPAYRGRFDRRWSIGSFSGLVRDLGAEAAPRVVPDAMREWQWRELVTEEPMGAARTEGVADGRAAEARDEVALAPAHRFPRGAVAGNFLHDQLEWLAEQRFALGADPALRERLVRRCERQGWGHRAADVVAWLERVVATPLPAFGAPLRGLSVTQPEMEFWLPGEGGVASRLDALCKAFLLPGLPRPALPERTLRGMLMGFADLVVEHDGRWWVLDYKSNALGLADADYHRDALAAAMAGHRYDVQAAIYLLALHRLLASRLGDAYDPARHVGGAVFLFLRGIDGPEAGCVHLAPPASMLAALDRVLGGRDEEAA